MKRGLPATGALVPDEVRLAGEDAWTPREERADRDEGGAEGDERSALIRAARRRQVLHAGDVLTSCGVGLRTRLLTRDRGALLIRGRFGSRDCVQRCGLDTRDGRGCYRRALVLTLEPLERVAGARTRCDGGCRRRGRRGGVRCLVLGSLLVRALGSFLVLCSALVLVLRGFLVLVGFFVRARSVFFRLALFRLVLRGFFVLVGFFVRAGVHLRFALGRLALLRFRSADARARPVALRALR